LTLPYVANSVSPNRLLLTIVAYVARRYGQKIIQNQSAMMLK
jgi:hypothetical protein